MWPRKRSSPPGNIGRLSHRRFSSQTEGRFQVIGKKMFGKKWKIEFEASCVFAATSRAVWPQPFFAKHLSANISTPTQRSTKSLPQHRDASWHRGVGAFLAFELERDVAAVVHFGKNSRDSFVVWPQPFFAKHLSANISTPTQRSTKSLPQHRDASWHRGVGAFLAFELERDVAAVVHFGKNSRDSFVVQFERIPV